MTKEFVSPPNVHSAPTYSHAVKAGNTIYVSGQVGCAPDGQVAEGFRAQAETAFENLRLVLEAVGASIGDIVKLNTFLTDMSNRPVYSEVRSRYFPGPFPAATLIQVAALARPEFMIEVEAVVVVD